MTVRPCLLFVLAVASSTTFVGCGSKAPPAGATANGPALLVKAATPSFTRATAADVEKVAQEVTRFGGKAGAPTNDDVPAVFVQFPKGAPKEAEVPDLVRRLTAVGVPVTLHVESQPELPPGAYTQFLDMPNLLGLEADGHNLLTAIKDHNGAPRLEAVTVGGPTVTDISPVAKLKRLRVLSVRGPHYVVGGLDRLAELPEFHSLTIQSAGMSGATLPPIWRLPALQELHLHGGTIADADLAPLANMTNLRKVFLSSARITKNVYEHLTTLPELRSPIVLPGGTGYTDTSLEHFGRLRNVAELEPLELGGAGVTDAGLAHLRGMTGLKNLSLSGTPKVGAKGMAVIAQLPNLTRLAIGTGIDFPSEDAPGGMDSGPTDTWIPPAAALDGLVGTKSLKQLSLSNTTDEYLIPVARIRSLEELELRWHTVHGKEATARLPQAVLTDAGLAHLRGATQLRKLTASGARVSDAGLAHLSGLTQLTELRIYATADPSGTRITDDGVGSLVQLTGLHYLQLSRTTISDAGVAKLAALPALKTLSLLETPLTDAVIDGLAKFPALESVSVSGSVTAAGLNRLRAAKKGIRINGR